MVASVSSPCIFFVKLITIERSRDLGEPLRLIAIQLGRQLEVPHFHVAPPAHKWQQRTVSAHCASGLPEASVY